MSTLLSSPSLQALAWALVHFIWQGAALALLAAAVIRIGRLAARARYVVGVMTLAAMLAAPVFTWVVLAAPASGAGALGGTDEAGALTIAAAAAAQAAAMPISVAPFVLPIWLAGVAMLSARLLGGWVVARRMTRRAVQPVASEICALASRLADRLAVPRAVEILQSGAVAVPMMVGWFRPVVLLPAAALSGLTPQQIEALLAHELAHVRRHDYIVNLLQAGIETLLFYHPAVWWISRQVRADRERCCDDLAIEACGDRLAYVNALADLATLTTPSMALAATGGPLLSRIRRILAGRDDQDAPGGWTPALLAAMLCAALVPVFASPAQEALPDVKSPHADGVHRMVLSGRVELVWPADDALVPQAATSKEPASEHELAFAELAPPDQEPSALDPLGESRIKQELLKQELEALIRKLNVEETRSGTVGQLQEQMQKRADEVKMLLRKLADERELVKPDGEAKEKMLAPLREKTELLELANQKKALAEAEKQLLDVELMKRRLVELEAATKMLPAGYRLQTNDVVNVTVEHERDRLTATGRAVEANGNLLLPMVGTIKLGGLTVAEASEAIAKAYAGKGFGPKPVVRLTIGRAPEERK